MSDHHHLIGLLLGIEEDWPTAFEAIVRRLGTVHDGTGVAHRYDVERITIEPFDLRQPVRTPWSSTASPTGTTTPVSG